MNFAATTSLRNRAGGRPATNSFLRRLPVLVTSASLTAMLFVTTAAPAAAAMAAPALVQAQGLTDSKVLVLWTPVATATSYDVYRGASHVGTTVPRARFEDTVGLTASTPYSYTVTATGPGGTSPASSAATATTQSGPPDTTDPAFSVGTLQTPIITSNSVKLTWPHASDNVGVVGYRIFRGEDALTPPANTPMDIITTDVTLSYTATNLKAGTDYTFEVQAIDAADRFSPKLTANVTTLSATDSAPPTVPSGTIFVTPFSDTRIDITWGTVSGAVGYQIKRGGTLIGEVDEPASPWFSDAGLTAGTYDYTIVAISSGGIAAAPSVTKSGTTLASGAVKVVRGPYVQWVTQSSARIAWWTNIPSQSVVKYGTVSLNVTASDATPGTGAGPGQDQEHVVLLDSLTPTTAYIYTVGNGTVASAQATFKTSVAAGTSFSFDAIGDYGAASLGQTQNAGRIAIDGSQFLQTLGDNVYSEASDPNFTQQYSEFDGHFFKPMKLALAAKALWTANGNKEYYGHKAWFEVTWAPNNEKWYSYDWGDAHIVVLDSSQPFDPSSPQYAWAQADLQAHQSSVWRIVVIQDPPYSSTSANSSSVPVETSLVPLFEAQGVQLVLSGNSHNYERSKPLLGGVPAAGGITYMVSGNGGNAFNPFTIAQPAYSAFRQASLYGYLNISVSPTAITVNEISAADGTTLDTTTINAILAATYHPLAGPVRIVDSRSGLGLPTKLTTNVPQSFQVTGVGGVLAGATAITGNVTVTEQTAYGLVALTTTSQPNPTTSTINFPLGDNRANGVTTPLGAAGKLWATYVGISPGSTTQLIFDITGYFTADATGSTYHALAGPVRIVDSRSGLGLPTKLTTNVPQSFQVTGVGGVLAGATAITGNVTVTEQTAYGLVALTTTSQPNPTTSTINFPLGDNRANVVTTPLGAAGKLWATYVGISPGSTTELIFDVTGYFTADATGSTYRPLAGPVRMIDSRTPLGLASKLTTNVPQSTQVTAANGIPTGATAITGNVTVTQQTAYGLVALTTTSQPNPTTSTINFPLGDNRANGVTTPLGSGGVMWATYVGISPGSTTELIFDVSGYFAP